MGSSLSSGLAGLQAYQQFIDVVGNNIANANTPGYRGQRALFAELFAQTLRPATGPSGSLGGVNPMQIGLGVRLGAVTSDGGQGSLIATGRALDLAIEGNGFFALTDGVHRFFTRVGSFGFDAQESLVDQRTGYKVLSPSGSTIQVDADAVVPAKATETIEFQGNFPAKVTGPKIEVLTTNAPLVDGTTSSPATSASFISNLTTNTTNYIAGDTIAVTGVDADGSAVSATFVFGTGSGQNGVTVGDLVTFLNTKFSGATAALTAAGNITLTADAAGDVPLSLKLSDNAGQTQWTEHEFDVTTEGADPDEVTTSIEVFDGAGLGHTVTMTFARELDGSWTMSSTLPATDGTIVSGTVSDIRFNPDGSFAGVFGPTGQIQILFNTQTQTQIIDLGLGTASDFDGLTQFGDEATAQAKSQDGYAAGSLSTINVNGNGELVGFFSNGVEQVLGQVGVATFSNSEGLARQGDTNFSESANSGISIFGTAGTGGVGAVRSGVLEASNVDVAREFVALIEAQRGFQANARVISATDSLLAEVVNIIR